MMPCQIENVIIGEFDKLFISLRIERESDGGFVMIVVIVQIVRYLFCVVYLSITFENNMFVLLIEIVYKCISLYATYFVL